MSIRDTIRRLAVATAAAAMIGTVATFSLAAPAFASSPASGTNCGSQAGGNGFPNCAAPIAPYSAGTPFSSGQTIDVTVPANSILTPGAGINILECSDPGGLVSNDPTSIANCDGNTIQGNTVLVQSNGSVNDNTYQVYALPDALIGDTGASSTTCNTTHYCVLYIGQNQENFSGAPYYLSQPFLVTPTAGDAGTNPGDGTPEAPLAIGLPLAAVGMIGGVTLVRRRRHTKATAGSKA